MMYCRAGKMRCPLLDKSSGGKNWCVGPEVDPWWFERCPSPKKRDHAIKKAEDNLRKLKESSSPKKPKAKPHQGQGPAVKA